MTTHISTDVIIDAVRATRDVYISNARRIVASTTRGNIVDPLIAEINRARLMDEVLKDEDLCEMLAGRIYQISHGTPRK